VLGVILHASFYGGRHEEHCSLDFGCIGYGFGGVRRQRQAGDGSDLDDVGTGGHLGRSSRGPDRHVGSTGRSGDPGSSGNEVIAS
jgi:hypothetical protein